jgi:hypothetical protein
MFDIVLVKRWNLKWGVPDHAMYMFGDAFVYQVCYTLQFMPGVLLTSKLCPKAGPRRCSAIRNPQSTIRNPQSTIRNPQSTIHNPQSTSSTIRHPHSTSSCF